VGRGRVEFRILGPVEAGQPGSRADLGGPRERALLARLLLSANHVVSADRLAEDLWSGDPPAHWAATLRVYVSRLRRALGESSGALITRPPGYGLVIADGQLDAAGFDRLATVGAAELAAGRPQAAADVIGRALSLWRGQALGDVADMTFAQAHASRLEESRLAATENLMTAELACGRHAAVAGELEMLTDSHPMREQLWALRITALYRSGRQADALSAYRALRTHLAEELGVDPSPELRQLNERVLRQDPALAWPTGASQPDAPGEPPASALPRDNGSASRLPMEPNAFIGRERELATIGELLGLSRLLTLTGPGGSGKSRLAIRYASQFQSRYADGVCLTDLAAVLGSEYVVPALASALVVSQEGNGPLLDSIIARLADRHVLIIFDNCEHVLEAAAAVVTRLLRSCPAIRILATSQIRMNVDGEATWPVPTMTVPGPSAHGLPEIATAEAVRLLCDRGSLARPGFAMTEDNAAGIAYICRRLDGIPLAIELAAARLNVLSVRQLADRLDDRFRVLTGGSRAALPRHRALLAAIEWSHDLLNETEQTCLRRLAVFPAGFTLDAAEAVCPDAELPADLVLETVTSLVDKSLLSAEEHPGAMRYRMLESVRHYAAGRLGAAGERADADRRLLGWLLGMTSAGDPDGPEQSAWLELVQADLDNCHAGLENAFGPDSDQQGRELGLALAGRLAPFWLVRGPVNVGRRWLATALSAAGPDSDPRVRALALDGAGQLAGAQGDQLAQFRYQEQSLTIWRALADDAKVARCLGDLGAVAHVRGDFVTADELYREALELALRADNDELIGRALSGLGRLALEHDDDLARATDYYEQSIARFRAAGNYRRATVILGNLGVVALHEGDLASARDRLTQHLANARRLRDRKLIGGALTNLGSVSFAAGDLAEAASMQREALNLGEQVGDRRVMCFALINLAAVVAAGQDYDAARVLLRRSVELAVAVGDQRAVLECLTECGATEAAAGNHERAVLLFGAIHAMRTELGIPVTGSEVGRIAAASDTAERALGCEQFAASHAAGGALSRREVIEVALA
jgi:predicted ATPase/DNA-binding SARP family transcriptional activator